MYIFALILIQANSDLQCEAGTQMPDKNVKSWIWNKTTVNGPHFKSNITNYCKLINGSKMMKDIPDKWFLDENIWWHLLNSS